MRSFISLVTDPPTTTTTVTTTHSTPKTTTTADVNEDDIHHESDRLGKTGEMESRENRGHSLHERKSKGGGKVSSEDEDNKESDDNDRDHHGGNYGKSGHEDDVEEERTINKRQRINKTNEDGDSGKVFGWTDARQNGYWGYDKHGNMTWIVHRSKESGSEEDGRSNKTQAVDGYDNSDYQVLPVGNHHGHSKKNHSSKRKTVKSDSKAKNRTASNEPSGK